MIFKCTIASAIVCGMLSGVTYEEALQKTLLQSPAIRVSLIELEERVGDQIQSGLFFNPLFSYTVENVFGNKSWRGWKSAESRYEISQPIQIGGERGYRVQAASYKLEAAQFEHCYLELKIVNGLKKAFLEAAFWQEMVRIFEEKKKIADEIKGTVLEKRGKISILGINRVLLEAADGELALLRAKSSLLVSLQRLAAFWGEKCVDAVEYSFYDFDCPLSLEECFDEKHPLLIKTQFDQLAACQEIKLQKAAGVPDVLVTAGVKTLQNSNEKGLILGFAVPLPVFNRNQGNVYRTEAQYDRIFNLYLDQKLALETRLLTFHQEAMRAYSELVQIKSTLLKIAEDSFSLVQEGQIQGKFEYFDVLEARMSLFNIQERYLKALFTFFEKQTEIEYLTL